ncbi:unnamed protein product [Amoebophrya sp. A25]|nr:unnamed protein product [Amoebophrya sp. A25]|eukprot:GSA25T00027468001.1
MRLQCRWDLESYCDFLEKDGALEGLMRLLELRKAYIGEKSTNLQYDYQILILMLEIYIAVGKTKPPLGFSSVDSMKTKIEEIKSALVIDESESCDKDESSEEGCVIS